MPNNRFGVGKEVVDHYRRREILKVDEISISVRQEHRESVAKRSCRAQEPAECRLNERTRADRMAVRTVPPILPPGCPKDDELEGMICEQREPKSKNQGISDHACPSACRIDEEFGEYKAVGASHAEVHSTLPTEIARLYLCGG